jgi:cell division protein FtsZ
MIDLVKEDLFGVEVNPPAYKHMIIGVGSAGVNILDQIYLENRKEPALFVMDTDQQVIRGSVLDNKMLLASARLRGLGTGGDWELGAEAVGADWPAMKEKLNGATRAIVVCGLGGGTGSSIAPEVVKWLKERSIETSVFAVTPFAFEGNRRRTLARNALTSIRRHADLVLAFSNDRVLHLPSTDSDIRHGYQEINRVLGRACVALRRLISGCGLEEIAMSELQQLSSSSVSGIENCWVGDGVGVGEQRIREAVRAVMGATMFEDGRAWEFGERAVVSFTGGKDFTLADYRSGVNMIRAELPDGMELLAGCNTDENMGQKVGVSLFVSGDLAPETVQVPAESVFRSLRQLFLDGTLCEEEQEKTAKPETQSVPSSVEEDPDDDHLKKTRPMKKCAPPEPLIPVPIPVAALENHDVKVGESQKALKIEITEVLSKLDIPDPVMPALAEKPAAAQMRAVGKRSVEPAQAELPLETARNRGWFEKARKTLWNGEDLDVPTYQRMKLAIKV